MNDEPPARVTPATLIVDPATDTVPAVATVYPGALCVVDGADQPVVSGAGTTTSTSPPETPPAAAVKVKVNVCPVDAADTAVGDTLMVPLPSAASATAP